MLIGDETGAFAPTAAAIGDARVDYRKNETRLGYSGNHVALLDRAKGRYLAVLHDDDWWEPTYLASMVDALETSPTDRESSPATSVGMSQGRAVQPDHGPSHCNQAGMTTSSTSWCGRSGSSSRPVPCGAERSGRVPPGRGRCICTSRSSSSTCLPLRRDGPSTISRRPSPTGSNTRASRPRTWAATTAWRLRTMSLEFWDGWLRDRSEHYAQMSRRQRANTQLRRARALLLLGDRDTAREALASARQLAGAGGPGYTRLAVGVRLPLPVLRAGLVSKRSAARMLGLRNG